MKLVEINLSGSNLERVKTLCESLSKRFSGCTLYKTTGYWTEEGYWTEDSYEGITKEEGYGVKVLIDDSDDLNRLEKVIRVELKDSDFKWVQVLSYEVNTHHVDLRVSL